MSFLNDFIPLFSSFLGGFADLFLFPMISLCFLCTVPFLIRSFVKTR